MKKLGILLAAIMFVSVAFAIAEPVKAVRNYWDWESSGFVQRYAYFGSSVAGGCDVNSDGYGDVIVGAPQYDTLQIDAGIAYLFLGAPYGLNKNPVWTSSGDDQVGAQFGYAVACAGDVNNDGFDDVIVGAPYWDSVANTDVGKAYVFHGTSSGLEATDAWNATGEGQAGAQFGYSVSTAGDVNGDSFDDVIIGAPFFDDNLNGFPDVGKAYLYTGSASGLGSTFIWDDWGDDESGAGFGYSVSGGGNVNGDAYDDIIVGGPYTNGPGTRRGAAFLYRGSPTGPSPSYDWNAYGASDSAYYGYSVSFLGSVIPATYDDVVIGIPRYLSGTTVGAAEVRRGNGVTLGGVLWRKTGDSSGSYFGASVAGAGDVNNDGRDDIIVGIPYQIENLRCLSLYGNPCPSNGRVDVFLSSRETPWAGGQTWIKYTPTFTHYGVPNGYQYLGTSVSSAGDVNGDGYADIIVGAPGWRPVGGWLPGTSEGRAYVFMGTETDLSLTAEWTSIGMDQATAWYGFSLASAGDVNGDGFEDIIVGSPGHNTVNNDAGRVYVYPGSAGGLGAPWATSGDDVANTYFGYSVAGDCDVNGDGYDDII
ncbi:MAG: integrin alpha, partial [Thermoplasmata archaeon]